MQVTWTDADEPFCMVASAKAAGGSSHSTGSRRVMPIHGAGLGRGVDEATVRAFAETIERYSAATFHEEQFLWQAADKLEERALDLATIPYCSEKERRNPRCSLQVASKTDPIRWVRGISLHDGKEILVPAVMVYSHAGWRGPQERFWLPISTGCAAHTSYNKAVISAICEVVERDAISLVWLQQLALPRLALDFSAPGALERFWELHRGGGPDIEYHFFDATTDVGLPTVYGVQVSHHHRFARNIVACATALTVEEALLKTMEDLVGFKRAFTVERTVPPETDAFTGLLDGATYMGRPEHSEAFAFLLRSPRTVSLRELCQSLQPPKSLRELLRFLDSQRMQVIAVDLTTDEARRAGLCVVRVMIPELQPLSLHTAAQYLGHPRLYHAPRRMGFPVRAEADLNRWPQPFA